ncbi:hypothetical protein [Paenibacillus solani]|uniref:hypothetical protein n=1 Tax=Paenibacillus solani TaxID=1705565 RepID=UPI003D2A406B
MKKVGEPVKEYSLKEISESLGIADRTLRRWSLLLERNGYPFQMNKTTRVYTDTEYYLFSNIKRSINGVSVYEAITMAIQNQQPIPEENPNIHEKINEFDQYINRLEEEIFWNGHKNTIENLMREWAKVKKSLGQSSKESLIDGSEQS